ncbi:MAG: hypothetical protein AAFV90_12900 [Cyanobacteria bacterium J06634_5]
MTDPGADSSGGLASTKATKFSSLPNKFVATTPTGCVFKSVAEPKGVGASPGPNALRSSFSSTAVKSSI